MSTALGRVSGELAEQFAYLNSPAAIAGEIARLESAIRGGDATTETHTLLRDWREVRAAQRKLLVVQEGGEG
jgi:hypothetical protein